MSAIDRSQPVHRLLLRIGLFAIAVAVGVGAAVLVFLALPSFLASAQAGAARRDYVDIADVPVQNLGRRAGGTFSSACGRNEMGHHNSDNLITLPDQPGAAQHVHEYVGNTATDANATNTELAAAATTCSNGDRSAYFWNVLRHLSDQPTGSSPNHDAWYGGEHNPGHRIPATSVQVQFHGNSTAPVIAMPPFLRLLAGNARAGTVPATGASRPQWSCSGEPLRRTQLYPLCPPGQDVVRTYDFPSCWDGLHTDSANHRSHVVYPTSDGGCPHNTFPIPQLRLTVTYSVKPGRSYAIDAFPDQHRSPLTDHAEFINVMPAPLMAQAVRCINSGETC